MGGVSYCCSRYHVYSCLPKYCCTFIRHGLFDAQKQQLLVVPPNGEISQNALFPECFVLRPFARTFPHDGWPPLAHTTSWVASLLAFYLAIECNIAVLCHIMSKKMLCFCPSLHKLDVVQRFLGMLVLLCSIQTQVLCRCHNYLQRRTSVCSGRDDLVLLR